MIVRTFVSHIWEYLLPFEGNSKECLQFLLEVKWDFKLFQLLFAAQPVHLKKKNQLT